MRPCSTRTQPVALSQRTPTTSKTRSVHWHPSRSRAWVIAGVHGVTFGRATRCAASDATFSLKEVDVGLAADLGILARIPKLVANELAFSPSRRARLAGERRCAALGLVSRVVPGLGAEVVGTGAPPLSSPRRSCVEVWKILVAVVGTKRFIADALHHSCVVILAPSTFRRMNLCFAGLVYDRLAEYKVRPILRKIMILANILFLCGIPRAAWLHNRRLPTPFLPRLFSAMLYLYQCPENSFFPTWSTYQTKVATGA